MGVVTPMGQDERTQKQHKLVSEIAKTGKFGTPTPQEGSNGQEFLFHCPICVEDDGKGEGHRPHLFVARAVSEGRTTPYVGCRIHTAPEDWQRIHAQLVGAGIPSALLDSKTPRGKRGAKVSPSSLLAKALHAEFKMRDAGLGDESPIPERFVDLCAQRLWKQPSAGALEYLRSRGLVDDTIEAAQFGLTKSGRLLLPIRGFDGAVVSARVRPIGRQSNWRPLAHPKLTNPATGKPLTYGPPTRLYGVRELALDAAEADGLSRPVWICAGEFDRLVLLQSGFLSVTGTSGEGALPRAQDAQHLVGRDVVIVMDCDKAGRLAAQKWAVACAKIGVNNVRILDLDAERNDGWDVSDYFAEHDSAEFDAAAELANRVDGLPRFELPESDSAQNLALDELSDRRMAEIVASRYSDRLKFVIQSQTWIVWDDKRWQQMPFRDNSPATNAIVDTARDVRKVAVDYGDEEYAEVLRKFMHNYLMSRHGSVREHLTTLGGMRIPIEALDRLPVLNTPAGILDLETGEVRPHDASAYLRWMTNGSYLSRETRKGLPIAESERLVEWTSFVKRVLPSLELRRFVQKLLGYSLLDGNPHRLLVFVQGGTSTGKSVFAETVMQALGSYAGPFNMSLLRDNQDEKPRADIVDSLTQRVIFASETSAAFNLHADAIKRMTGNDSIKARLPHRGEFVERIPAFTPWIRTNEVPTVNGADAALDRRLLVVPFKTFISPEEEDPRAMDQLRRESSDAVITWAMEGLRRFWKEGFGDLPIAMINAKQEFSTHLSPVHSFISEMCELGETHEEAYCTPIADLYDGYSNWCFNSGIRDVESRISFGRKLTGMKIDNWMSNGVRYRRGIRLKSLAVR